MNDTEVIGIAIRMFTITAELSAPMLITALVVGLGVSLLQSVTQIQEATLSFLPKLAAVALVLVISGRWMLNSLVSYTHQMFSLIPQLIGS
jgi:flagellar biosynthesis protein FliQ